MYCVCVLVMCAHASSPLFSAAPPELLPAKEVCAHVCVCACVFSQFGVLGVGQTVRLYNSTSINVCSNLCVHQATVDLILNKLLC